MTLDGTPPGADKLLRAAEVALRLSIEPRTLAAWRQRGVGPPPVRLTARLIRYRDVDVEQWLRARGATP